MAPWNSPKQTEVTSDEAAQEELPEELEETIVPAEQGNTSHKRTISKVGIEARTELDPGPTRATRSGRNTRRPGRYGDEV